MTLWIVLSFRYINIFNWDWSSPWWYWKGNIVNRRVDRLGQKSLSWKDRSGLGLRRKEELMVRQHLWDQRVVVLWVTTWESQRDRNSWNWATWIHRLRVISDEFKIPCKCPQQWLVEVFPRVSFNHKPQFALSVLLTHLVKISSPVCLNIVSPNETRG